ncbi:MAG: carboxymuconolactone decarboxylase family protein [Dehalococcoidia bacterium]
MSRQTVRTRDDLTEEQQASYDAVFETRGAQPDGTLGGPFDPWLLNPELSHRMRGMGGFLWTRTSLARGIVELAISITARFWRSNVEWAAHAPRAVEYGIAQEVLDSVLAEQRPDDAPEEQGLLYDVCMFLHQERGLSRELYDRAVATFGEQGLVEIIGVIGYYATVSMTLNAFEVEVAPGVEAAFERGP